MRARDVDPLASPESALRQEHWLVLEVGDLEHGPAGQLVRDG